MVSHDALITSIVCLMDDYLIMLVVAHFLGHFYIHVDKLDDSKLLICGGRHLLCLWLNGVLHYLTCLFH